MQEEATQAAPRSLVVVVVVVEDDEDVRRLLEFNLNSAGFDVVGFRGDGKWSDAKVPRRKLALDDRLLGSFKTLALRGVPVTAPYGHGGSVPSLAMAIDLHRTLGMPAGNRLTTGVVEPWLVPFDEERSPSLLAFLQALGFGR